MAWMEQERAALVATARETDPDAPTLCEGWTARHLLAHLVQRERRPLHQLADVLSRPDPGEERFQGQLVDAARTSAGWQALIDRFATGPPRWSPLAWPGDAANLIEYVVHHEDLRRGGPDPVPPREVPEPRLEAIWRRLAGASKLLVRGSPVGVVLEAPGRGRHVARDAEPGVTLTGEPVELALQLFGRSGAADVEVTGPPDAVERYHAWAG